MQNISLKSALELLLDSCTCRKFKMSPTSKRKDSSGTCVPDKRAVTKAKKALAAANKKVPKTPPELYSWPHKRVHSFKYLGRTWKSGMKAKRGDADYMDFVIGADGYIEASYGNGFYRSLNYYFAPLGEVKDLVCS